MKGRSKNGCTHHSNRKSAQPIGQAGLAYSGLRSLPASPLPQTLDHMKTPPRIARKEQIAVAVFASWLFFAPLAGMMFTSISKRVTPELLVTFREFFLATGLLGFSGGLGHALLFAFTPNKISHAIFPALCVGLLATTISFVWFLTQHSSSLAWPLTSRKLYFGFLLFSVSILFSYFVLDFIIRKQDV